MTLKNYGLSSAATAKFLMVTNNELKYKVVDKKMGEDTKRLYNKTWHTLIKIELTHLKQYIILVCTPNIPKYINLKMHKDGKKSYTIQHDKTF